MILDILVIQLMWNKLQIDDLNDTGVLNSGNCSGEQPYDNYHFSRIALVLKCSMYKSPWRNRLARSAVNRKVAGSSPHGNIFFFMMA